MLSSSAAKWMLPKCRTLATILSRSWAIGGRRGSQEGQRAHEGPQGTVRGSGVSDSSRRLSEWTEIFRVKREEREGPWHGSHLNFVLSEVDDCQSLPDHLPVTLVVDGGDFGALALGEGRGGLRPVLRPPVAVALPACSAPSPGTGSSAGSVPGPACAAAPPRRLPAAGRRRGSSSPRGSGAPPGTSPAGN